ncbi:hypothetical protein SAMN04487902_104178 [Prevotella sp. ne3005]|uniref:hypothetical protein n=1 Tax=Prevotella sp. ne3005 TaxID=1761887 RepID=UPI0008D68756|nr:hypothetical protein [Prevotella sp. ne3005]SEM87247.1 hypothetical protein SAMN04487902_104178 [Prevotella sp. ne3005]
MKKYLMIGVAALAFAVTLTSCSKAGDLYDESRVEQQKEATVNEKYAAAFEKAFGKVGPNVDWGFSSKSSSTRSFTRAVGTYAQYKGNMQPSITFPSDCNANNFNPDLTNVPSYNDYLISKGTQWWTPEEINDGGVVYINAVQPIKISGGSEEQHAKLYIKAGTYDFRGVSFDLNINTDLVLLEGATVTFDNTVASTAIFDIYIAQGAELIANGEKGLVANSGIHVYNHGTITCSKFEVNSTSFLYNVGTLTADSVKAESNDSRIVNDGTINSTTVVVNAGAVQNNDIWTVSGTTKINSNNSGWVNNGHWTTYDYAYIGGSENVINNCLLTVTHDFEMNISSETGAFKIDGGGGVLTKNFYGGRDSSTGAISGPFRINMGANAVFVVEETAQFESGRGDDEGFGIFGVSSDAPAVFQARDIVRDPTLLSQRSHGAVTYGGNLYVSAETHFAQGDDGSKPFIYVKDGFTIENNIYASGFKSGKPSITIPETPCSPGFIGGNPLYRVIAEDLSASEAGDFDFNDVVFDVVKAEGGKTTLKLICAGGTLPLRVRGANQAEGVEVHSVFGEDAPGENGKYQMFNTGAGPTVPEATFTVQGEYTTPEQIKNIIIEVKKDNTWMPLPAKTGEPACKILVDDTFKPVIERRNIANENKKFTNYVQGTFVDDFWWK